ncbi:hypothetical protein ES703_103353 [subsurface metagenome]
MESFIAGNKKYGRNVDYLALDDSSAVESRRKTHRLLSARAEREKVSIFYAGETAGEIADDTVCRFAEPFEKENGLELFSFFDPTEIDFFPDRQTLLESTEFSDRNILLRHEDLLGRAKVLVTLTGIDDDSGLCSPRMILGLRGESRKRLMCSQSVYFSATTSREVLRAVKRYTNSEGPLCVSALLGLDNRRLLPPFFPVMRNEDGILAVTLRTCFKGGLIGHLPLAALHDPSEPRRFAPEAIREMKPRIAEIISLLVQSYEPGPGVKAPEERLAAYDSTPEYWAGDVRAHLEFTRAFLTGRETAAPSDLREGRTAEDAEELCRWPLKSI